MRARIALVTSALIAAAAMSGCGSGDTTSTPSTAPERAAATGSATRCPQIDTSFRRMEFLIRNDLKRAVTVNIGISDCSGWRGVTAAAYSRSRIAPGGVLPMTVDPHLHLTGYKDRSPIFSVTPVADGVELGTVTVRFIYDPRNIKWSGFVIDDGKKIRIQGYEGWAFPFAKTLNGQSVRAFAHNRTLYLEDAATT